DDDVPAHSRQKINHGGTETQRRARTSSAPLCLRASVVNFFYGSSTYRGSRGAASSFTAMTNCSPYCFTLYGPIPLICSSLASVSGACLAISLSVVSWQMQ